MVLSESSREGACLRIGSCLDTQHAGLPPAFILHWENQDIFICLLFILRESVSFFKVPQFSHLQGSNKVTCSSSRIVENGTSCVFYPKCLTLLSLFSFSIK